MTEIQVLLIEDDHVDAKAILRMLNEQPTATEIQHATTLADGLKQLVRGLQDVVLLDLALPDSRGLETLSQVLGCAPGVPVVVLTGANDEETGLSAVRGGAQDYLLKGEVTSTLLMRTMRYSIERQQLLKELEETRLREQQERERAEALNDYEHYLALVRTDELDGANGLPDRDRTLAHTLVPEYSDIVENYLRQGRVRDDPWSERVDEFAERLAALRLGSRAIMQLHLGVMNRVIDRLLRDMRRGVSNDAFDGRSLAKDGRLVLVELLSKLLEIYRRAAKQQD